MTLLRRSLWVFLVLAVLYSALWLVGLLVIQTVSKSHSLAGLRVGFAFGSVGLIEALDRVKEESLQEIFAEEFTVSQKVTYIVENIRSTKRLSLTDLFTGMKSRQEIVCTFLAVLELIKLNRIAAGPAVAL